jgi:hypothetical protein
MNKRLAIVVLGIVILGSGVLIVARHGNSTQKPTLKHAEIPDAILYKHVFQHVLALKKRAEKADSEGKDSKQFRTHFKRQAELSDGEAETLDRVAAEWDQEMAPIEARAKLLSQTYKAQFPGGQLPHGQTPPPPPPELRTLSEERDASVLRARDRLKTALGETEFNRFHAFVKEKVAPNVQIIKPGAASTSQAVQ